MKSDPKEDLIIGLKQIETTLDRVFGTGSPNVGFFTNSNARSNAPRNPQSIEAYKKSKASIKHLTDLTMDALMLSHAPKLGK